MKNSADLGGCYPPRPSASVDNALLDLQNSSYPTQPHLIIANSTRPKFVASVNFPIIRSAFAMQTARAIKIVMRAHNKGFDVPFLRVQMTAKPFVASLLTNTRTERNR